VDSAEARQWYVQESAAQNWSTRALERQIGSLYYERLLLSQDKAAVTSEAQSNMAALEQTPRAFVRDPVMLEFLGLPDTGRLLEAKLETALMDKLQHFLMELGKGFGHIDTVIGLPSNLFYSTGIPVCILVLKKCKKPDDVLFINAVEHFVKGKRQNQLTEEHIAKIIKTYQFRDQEARYSRRVEMAEIEKNEFNLNISCYISTAVGEAEIDLEKTNRELVKIEKAIEAAKQKHNGFLKELGLKLLP
jgi:predicted nuclease of restriction endonuclease-like (RecB) superfamily